MHLDEKNNGLDVFSSNESQTALDTVSIILAASSDK